MKLNVIWFDSMGAKSSCILVETRSVNVLIDPGAAVMQPSYPLPKTEKIKLLKNAVKEIEKASKKADVIVITHYHYDHHFKPSNPHLSNPTLIYDRKRILIKNPNEWINFSQFKRARAFIEELANLKGIDLKEIYEEAKAGDYDDPVENLTHALSMDFGDYAKRREELLKKGRRFFDNLTKIWRKGPWIKDKLKLGDIGIEFADSREFKFGNVVIRFSNPLFHGIEYDRTGWVLSVFIRDGKDSILYTSDLMGPQIEDYADMIISMKPKKLILDGPPIYLFPYMLNRINLNRAVENAKRIIKESKAEFIIYDHHLMREKGYMRYVGDVFREARKEGVKLIAASETKGEKPLIDRI